MANITHGTRGLSADERAAALYLAGLGDAEMGQFAAEDLTELVESVAAEVGRPGLAYLAVEFRRQAQDGIAGLDVARLASCRTAATVAGVQRSAVSEPAAPVADKLVGDDLVAVSCPECEQMPGRRPWSAPQQPCSCCRGEAEIRIGVDPVEHPDGMTRGEAQRVADQFGRTDAALRAADAAIARIDAVVADHDAEAARAARVTRWQAEAHRDAAGRDAGCAVEGDVAVGSR